MRVLLDTTFALRGPSGTATYLRHLGPALARAGVEVVAVADTGRRPPAGGGHGSVRNLVRDQRWLNAELPRLARAHKADVIHHPLPALAARCPTPQVITVHDLAFVVLPGHFAPAFRRFATGSHRVAARRADAVVAVSAATAEELRQLFDVPAERITVARHGSDDATPPSARAPEPDCFLYVGDDEPRKNLGLLKAAYARYLAALPPAHTPLALELVGVTEGVLAPFSHADVRGHYARAAALVHPSLHEGFGLTPLEAMAAGTPVLAYPSAGVREVCGDAALYAETAQAMADQLAALHLDPALRADRSERGRRRAATFSWARSARAHAAAYAAAIERGAKT